MSNPSPFVFALISNITSDVLKEIKTAPQKIKAVPQKKLQSRSDGLVNMRRAVLPPPTIRCAISTLYRAGSRHPHMQPISQELDGRKISRSFIRNSEREGLHGMWGQSIAAIQVYRSYGGKEKSGEGLI